MHLTFVGGGNMTTAMIGGLTKEEMPLVIQVVDHNPDKLTQLVKKFGIVPLSSLPECFSSYDIVILAVKPQNLKDVSTALRKKLNGALVVTVAAGINTQTLSRWLNTTRIVRVMPNTPAMIGKGISGLYASAGLRESDRQRVDVIMSAVGSIIWLDNEEKIDDITCLSGSGPAYVFYFIESMLEAAQQIGFDPVSARQVVLATFEGAIELAKISEGTIAQLRSHVTSKGGATERAIARFEQDGVKPIIIAGIKDCHARAIEMGQKLSQE